MRHMAVEFGLMDGWMDMFYVPCWAPKAPQALGWGGLLSEYIGHNQLPWSSSVSS